MKFLQNFEQFKMNEEATVNVATVKETTPPETIWKNSSMTINSYDEASKTGKFTFKSGDLSFSFDMKLLDTAINGVKMFEADGGRFSIQLKQASKNIKMMDMIDAAGKPIANFNNIKIVFALKDGQSIPLTTTTRLGIFGKVDGNVRGVKYMEDPNSKEYKYKDDVAGYGFFYYQSSATYINQPTPSFGQVMIKTIEQDVEPIFPPIKEPFIIDKTELTQDAITKIKEGTDKIKNKNIKLTVNTGASKDNENVQHDFDLIVGRYKTIVSHLNSLGFKNIEQIGVPKNINDTKNIYGKFNSQKLDSPENRNLVITPVK